MPITQQDFGNFKGAVVIETSKVKMVIRTDAGPRISHFGPANGNNLLLCDDEDRHRGDWHLMQGHRVWTTRPPVDESEDAYRPDNSPCSANIAGNDFVTITSTLEPTHQIRKGFSVTVVDEATFDVRNFVTNEGPMLFSCNVWSLTCTKATPGTTYRIPLGNGSEWDCFNILIPLKWAGHTSPLNDPQINYLNGMMVFTPQGVETKRGIESELGIIAMDVPGVGTFAKRTNYSRNARYPKGCNIAFYNGPDNFMTEMESVGAEFTLTGGETAYNNETWIFTEKAGLNTNQLVNLF